MFVKTFKKFSKTTKKVLKRKTIMRPLQQVLKE